MVMWLPVVLLMFFRAFGVDGATAPRMLSCIAGLHRCIGVPDVHTARAWGCVVGCVPEFERACTAQHNFNAPWLFRRRRADKPQKQRQKHATAA